MYTDIELSEIRRILVSDGFKPLKPSRPLYSNIIESFTRLEYSAMYESSFQYNYPINVDTWLKRLLKKTQWKTLDEAIGSIALPDQKYQVIQHKKSHTRLADPELILLNALVLSKCNDTIYNPDSPMIFTMKRLSRSVQLIKLNLDEYYEMD